MMSKLFISFILLFTFFGASIASAQTEYDDSEILEMILMLEYAVKQHLIEPIDARIDERYIAEKDDGAKILIIKCDRSDLYSDNYIKKKLHEFTEMKGIYGPESGFGANTDIIRPWQKREDIEEIDIDTVWLLYDTIVLNILLGEERVSFMLFKKYWE